MLNEFHIDCKKENFVAGWFLDDTSICNSIIDFHKQADTIPGVVGVPGVVGQPDKIFVNPIHKDSEDCTLLGPVLGQYGIELQKVLGEYIKKFPYCNFYEPWQCIEPITIQYYKPGAGYHGIHTERTSRHPPMSTRHLVFMTYLNTVTEGGETEFLQQGIKIQPKTGLTLIWPPDWTYTHRGIVSHTQEKYIVTGWFNFV